MRLYIFNRPFFAEDYHRALFWSYISNTLFYLYPQPFPIRRESISISEEGLDGCIHLKRRL